MCIGQRGKRGETRKGRQEPLAQKAVALQVASQCKKRESLRLYSCDLDHVSFESKLIRFVQGESSSRNHKRLQTEFHCES